MNITKGVYTTLWRSVVFTVKLKKIEFSFYWVGGRGRGVNNASWHGMTHLQYPKFKQWMMDSQPHFQCFFSPQWWLICKRLYPAKSVKYLGIKNDENLNWKQHIHDIPIKLNRANALLYTIRNFINRHILKTIYFAIFDTYINYAKLIWSQILMLWVELLSYKRMP